MSGSRRSLASLVTLKARLGITDTADDAALLAALETASQFADDYCGRWFQPRSEARYYTPARYDRVWLDDLLSASEVATDDGSRAWATVWASTDYDLLPDNELPRTALAVTPSGAYSLPRASRGLRVTGLWGHGDGRSATPYEASGATLTVATTTGTAVTATFPGAEEMSPILGVKTGEGVLKRIQVDWLRVIQFD